MVLSGLSPVMHVNFCLNSLISLDMSGYLSSRFVIISATNSSSGLIFKKIWGGSGQIFNKNPGKGRAKIRAKCLFEKNLFILFQKQKIEQNLENLCLLSLNYFDKFGIKNHCFICFQEFIINSEYNTPVRSQNQQIPDKTFNPKSPVK